MNEQGPKPHERSGEPRQRLQDIGDALAAALTPAAETERRLRQIKHSAAGSSTAQPVETAPKAQTVRPAAPGGAPSDAPHSASASGTGQSSDGTAASADSTRQAAAEQRRGLVVTCPACLGKGKVPRENSRILHGCMLCWERGVVSTIVADRWSNRGAPAE